MTHKLYSFISLTVCVLFLGAMFASLFTVSANMSAEGGMVDCPFMAHTDSLCPMSIADHIGAWKLVFLAILPTLIYFFVAAGAVALLLSVAPHLLTLVRHPTPVLTRQLRERTYTFFYRPLQEFFANGILHPQLYSR